MATAGNAATNRLGALAATIAAYCGSMRRLPRVTQAIVSEPSFRTAIVRDFEDRIRQTRHPHPDVAAIAIYGLLNAVLASRLYGIGSTEAASTALVMALQGLGLDRQEAAGFAAAGLALDQTLN